MIQIVEQEIGVGLDYFIGGKDLVLIHVLVDQRNDIQQSHLGVATHQLFHVYLDQVLLL